MNNNNIITKAQYYGHESVGFIIKAEIDGIAYDVPINLRNAQYVEIMRQVSEGTLVIQEAETSSQEQ